MHKFLFYNKYIASTCFENCCAYRQEVKIVLQSIWYHHTVGGRPVHRLREDSHPVHGTATYRV